MTFLSRAMGRFVAVATGLSGTLDILSAFLFSGLKGIGPITVLQSVASGPFGDSMFKGGAGAAVLGALVHYSIMAAMVTAYGLLATRFVTLARRPVRAGALYGTMLYLFMYWIILPARWPTLYPRTGAWDVGNALFSHLVCVGLPMALVWVRMADAPRTPVRK